MNRELTESSLLMRRMVSASNPATDSTRIFLHAWASFDSGIVSVTTNSSIEDWSIRATAPPDSTGCVQYATTRFAPSAFSACAALVSVLIDELERREQRYGCIAICGAAGVASAMVIERLAA